MSERHEALDTVCFIDSLIMVHGIGEYHRTSIIGQNVPCVH